VNRFRWMLLCAAIALLVSAGLMHAQTQVWRGGYGFTPAKFPTARTFGNGFNFCRLMFQSNRREKRGWDTDYPGADINFSIRLGELTKTRVSRDASEGGEPTMSSSARPTKRSSSVRSSSSKTAAARISTIRKSSSCASTC
jgi:hypothetical protein